jgi:hypothetical protein
MGLYESGIKIETYLLITKQEFLKIFKRIFKWSACPKEP